MPKKVEKCVKAVKKQNKKNKTDYNPWAVCIASIYGKKKKNTKLNK